MIFNIENWMDQWRKSKLSIFQYSGLREMSPNNNHNWLTKFHSESVILQFWKTEGRDLEIFTTEIACFRKYSHLTDKIYLINFTGVRRKEREFGLILFLRQNMFGRHWKRLFLAITSGTIPVHVWFFIHISMVDIQIK